MLDKLERKQNFISCISGHISDYRDPARVVYLVEKLLRQRVFTFMQGYEDCNDVEHLKNDLLFGNIHLVPAHATCRCCGRPMFVVATIHRGGPWPKAPPDFGTASRQYHPQQTANAL